MFGLACVSRHPNATPEMSFPVLVCGQHVVPSASLLRVLEDAFPLAAGVKVSDGADADAGRRRLSLLSREVDTAESLFHFKLWNEHSASSMSLLPSFLHSLCDLPSRVFLFSIVGSQAVRCFIRHGSQVE